MNHEAAVQDTSLKKYSKTDIFKKEKKKTNPKPTTNPKCYQIHWEKLKIKFPPQKNSKKLKPNQTNKQRKQKQTTTTTKNKQGKKKKKETEKKMNGLWSLSFNT